MVRGASALTRSDAAAAPISAAPDRPLEASDSGGLRLRGAEDEPEHGRLELGGATEHKKGEVGAFKELKGGEGGGGGRAEEEEEEEEERAWHERRERTGGNSAAAPLQHSLQIARGGQWKRRKRNKKRREKEWAKSVLEGSRDVLSEAGETAAEGEERKVTRTVGKKDESRTR